MKYAQAAAHVSLSNKDLKGTKKVQETVQNDNTVILTKDKQKGQQCSKGAQV